MRRFLAYRIRIYNTIFIGLFSGFANVLRFGDFVTKLNPGDTKFIPYKILQDYLACECILRARSCKIRQVSCKISTFLASFLQDKHFSSNLARFLQGFCKIFLLNNFLQDFFKALDYIGRLARNSYFLQGLASSCKNKFSVL